jgi:hypothetical protein
MQHLQQLQCVGGTMHAALQLTALLHWHCRITIQHTHSTSSIQSFSSLHSNLDGMLSAAAVEVFVDCVEQLCAQRQACSHYCRLLLQAQVQLSLTPMQSNWSFTI